MRRCFFVFLLLVSILGCREKGINNPFLAGQVENAYYTRSLGVPPPGTNTLHIDLNKDGVNDIGFTCKYTHSLGAGDSYYVYFTPENSSFSIAGSPKDLFLVQHSDTVLSTSTSLPPPAKDTTINLTTKYVEAIADDSLVSVYHTAFPFYLKENDNVASVNVWHSGKTDVSNDEWFWAGSEKVGAKTIIRRYSYVFGLNPANDNVMRYIGVKSGSGSHVRYGWIAFMNRMVIDCAMQK
ncbi:MAG: hypothetical protein K1X81_05010 [Bacteroidia bacterium]|nr:hypothetical protein [Bacteroidia bacterium]